MAGAGKSRLLRELAEHTSFDAGDWRFLDEPAVSSVEPALVQTLHGARVPAPDSSRLLIASRPTGAVADCLLKAMLYGQLDVIDEQELFVRLSDFARARNLEAFVATGGWPVLLDGHARGRGVEMKRMLPTFLDRDVLPELPAPVVTALFGALPAPLDERAVQSLFGKPCTLHPLLRATDAGVIVAGHWVHEALLELRTPPRQMRRATQAQLVRLHTEFGEPAEAIRGLLGIGEFARAVEVFDAAGGMFFGYRHSFQALERVLASFGENAEQRSENIFLARLQLLSKTGRSREALLRLDSQYAGLPLDLRRLRVSHRPYALLMRLDLSLDLDELPPLEVISSWGRLDAFLKPSDDIARGILYNTMALGFLQLGALIQAEEFALEALAVYTRVDSPYLSHFMLLHLCDLSLRRSRLREAAAHLQRAEDALAASRIAFNSEPAIIASFKARIAYEEGRFTDCPEDVEPILDALLRGDSWPDLLSALTFQAVFAAFWQFGLRKAQDRFEHCAVISGRRHGALQNRRLELLRIRLYQVARRHEDAGLRLEEFDLDTRKTANCADAADEALIRLRHAIVQARTNEAARKRAGKLAAALAGGSGLETRHTIALSLLQAHLHHRSDEHGMARRHLTRALRRAHAEGVVAPLIEDGEFLERMLPMFLAQPGRDDETLCAFAQRLTRLLRTLPAAPLNSKRIAGVTPREHQVMSYVLDGRTNKQVAKALGSSVSVVKFHLRNLFRKMNVTSRSALRHAAEKHGIRI